MLLAGDELGRTQHGNNNACCQDNGITWLDWVFAGKGGSLVEFVKTLTQMRHRDHILRRSRFLTGAYSEELGIRDVTWINAAGGEIQAEHWDEGAMKYASAQCSTAARRKRGYAGGATMQPC